MSNKNKKVVKEQIMESEVKEMDEVVETEEVTEEVTEQVEEPAQKKKLNKKVVAAAAAIGGAVAFGLFKLYKMCTSGTSSDTIENPVLDESPITAEDDIISETADSYNEV